MTGGRQPCSWVGWVGWSAPRKLCRGAHMGTNHATQLCYPCLCILLPLLEDSPPIPRTPRPCASLPLWLLLAWVTK